ncbi:SDR family oxidoreductase [Enterococcus sp. LJL120]
MGIIEKMRLDGKAAYVTGGAGGIGKSIATALAEAGAKVAIVDLEGGKAQEVADEIAQATGGQTLAVQTDVTDADSVNQMIETIVQAFGRLDIAFNNAGITMNIPAEEMSPEDWHKVIDLDLNGVFLTSQAAGKVMLKQGSGSIINTASMSGSIVNVPQPQASYNAAKAGVKHLSKSLAVEWADRGVRVNTISPGYIGTDLIFEAEELQPLLEKWEEITPQRRLGKPEELQGIALYLASDVSSFATGADFIIDGGYTAI